MLCRRNRQTVDPVPHHFLPSLSEFALPPRTIIVHTKNVLNLALRCPGSVRVGHNATSGATPLHPVSFSLLSICAQVVQHMLALVAIAFGKDMATATIISLEPFLAETPPLLSSKSPKPSPLLPGSSKKILPSTNSGNDAGSGDKSSGEGGTVDLMVHMKSAKAGRGVRKASRDSRGEGTVGSEEQGCYDWFVGPRGGLPWKRRRYSSLVLPVGLVRSDGLDAEAVERQFTVKTAARLGCAVGNLTKRQQKMLVAKVRCSVGITRVYNGDYGHIK